MSKIDRKSFASSLNRLRRSIDLRLYWNQSGTGTTPRSSYISRFLKSRWSPDHILRESHPLWKELVAKTSSIIDNDDRRPLDRLNLPPGVLSAWKRFNSNPDFYVLPADKGGKTVIWKSSDYMAEAELQLSDASTYRELSRADAEESIVLQQRARDIILEQLLSAGNITKAESDRIKEAKHKFPAFSLLPKIHKKKNPSTGSFFGRPVVCCTNSFWKNLDRFLADTTSILLRRIDGCVIDATDLLNAIENCPRLGENSILFSADVVALYPSMPWAETLNSATRFYTREFEFLVNHNEEQGLLPPPSPALFHQLLELILKNNIFHFQNNRFFLQLKGTTMGCSMSVFMANTFMFYRTEPLIRSPPPGLIFFKRYIDDFAGAYNGAAEAIPPLFVDVIDDSIKLTYEIGGRSLNVLDLTLTIENDGSISSRLFRKPTDGHQFVHWTSNHKSSLIPSLVGAQLIRSRRNCSKDADYTAEVDTLTNKFLSREFPRSTINKSVEEVTENGRAPLLIRKTHRPLERIVFVSQNLGSLDRPIGDAIRDFYTKLLESPLVMVHTARFGLPLPLSPPILAESNNNSLGSSLGPKYKLGPRR